jgi:hypothetical protein
MRFHALLLLASLLLGACNDMLDIHPPADDVLDAGGDPSEQ